MIYGKRIRLRHAEREDLATFIKWLNDPEVREGISMYLPMSMAEEEQWFEKSLERPPAERTLCIEIKQGRGWKLIGTCGYFGFDHRIRLAELGILIGEKNEWNKGYGTEVMQLLLRFGFDTLNLNRIWLRVYENNPRAVRAYEKAGFIEEGRQRQANYADGRYYDVIQMSALRDEWLTAHPEAKG